MIKKKAARERKRDARIQLGESVHEEMIGSHRIETPFMDGWPFSFTIFLYICATEHTHVGVCERKCKRPAQDRKFAADS